MVPPIAFYPRLGVRILPHPPDALNLGIMQEESRITQRRKEIARRVTIQRVMTGGMDTEIPALKVSLHAVLERRNIRAVVSKQVPYLVVGGPVRRHPARDIAT
jgi:hypothetical protein